MHAQTRWCRRPFVSAKHRLQQICLHRLHADPRSLRRQVQRRASRPPRCKRRVASSARVDRAIHAVAGRVVDWASARCGVAVGDQRAVRIVVSAAVGIRVASAGGATCHDAINDERPRPDEVALGRQSEHERLGASVHNNHGATVLILNLIVLLIGREKGTVHQHAVMQRLNFLCSGLCGFTGAPIPPLAPAALGGGGFMLSSAAFRSASCLSATFLSKALVRATSSAEGCLHVGSNFFNEPRVSFVYFINPFERIVSGCPTKQFALSDKSRMLQFSMNMRSPLHTYVTCNCKSCADATPAATNPSSATTPNMPARIFIPILLRATWIAVSV